jgi:hypothetical protein
VEKAPVIQFGSGKRLEPIGLLLAALSAAEDSVSRLDELTRLPLGEGLIARLEFQEACAWSWNRGDLVHLEDLVLHDAGLDVRMPDQELARTHTVLRRWRRTGRLKAEELLSAKAVTRVINPRRVGGRSKALGDLMTAAGVDPSRVRGGPFASERPVTGLVEATTEIDALLAQAAAISTDDDDEALEAWFGLEAAVPLAWPPLLRCAVLLEAWATIDPLPRHSHMGVILANALLKRAGRLRHHRILVETGRRGLGRDLRRPSGQSGLRRTVWQLQAIATAETLGQAEYDRLSLARQVVSRHLVGRRASSHLGEVIELFSERPIVTAGMIGERCEVSQQAARGLVAQLGSGVVEVSGRARFRAWRL